MQFAFYIFSQIKIWLFFSSSVWKLLQVYEFFFCFNEIIKCLFSNNRRSVVSLKILAVFISFVALPLIFSTTDNIRENKVNREQNEKRKKLKQNIHQMCIESMKTNCKHTHIHTQPDENKNGFAWNNFSHGIPYFCLFILIKRFSYNFLTLSIDSLCYRDLFLCAL